MENDVLSQEFCIKVVPIASYSRDILHGDTSTLVDTFFIILTWPPTYQISKLNDKRLNLIFTVNVMSCVSKKHSLIKKTFKFEILNSFLITSEDSEKKLALGVNPHRRKNIITYHMGTFGPK